MFRPKARIILPTACPSVMQSPNMAGGGEMWGTPRTTPPARSFAAAFDQSLEHATAARIREFDCDASGQAAADRAPRIHGRHFARIAGSNRASACTAGRHHRLGGGGTLGRALMHPIGTSFRPSLTAAAADRSGSHS